MSRFSGMIVSSTQVITLMDAVKTTLLNDIDDLKWMDDVTKKRAKQTVCSLKTNYAQTFDLFIFIYFLI